MASISYRAYGLRIKKRVVLKGNARYFLYRKTLRKKMREMSIIECGEYSQLLYNALVW